MRLLPLALAAALATLLTPDVGGPAQPLVLRTVTIGQETGLAYYSPIEGGFRFVGGSPVQSAAYEASSKTLMAAAGR